jgi:hypothetical protein
VSVDFSIADWSHHSFSANNALQGVRKDWSWGSPCSSTPSLVTGPLPRQLPGIASIGVFAAISCPLPS